MIVEVALITVRPGSEAEFLGAFQEAQKILASSSGYRSHTLGRSIEAPNRFALTVQWEQLTDHTEGFRGSPAFARWRALIGPFFESPPVVEHYRPEQRDQTQIELLIGRFYAAFDNRAGRSVDMTGLREMFLPDARVTRLAAGKIDSWSVNEFIAPREALLTDGTLVDFHEWEVEGDTTLLGNIAEHRSKYRKSGQMRGLPYVGEGRKFVLLARSEARWRIVSVLWEDTEDQ